MILDTPSRRRALLDAAKTVAIVGASEKPARASFFVLRYLRTHGYDVWPVNPAYAVIDGLRCYPTLTELAAARGVPDVVDVFRRPEALPELVEEVVAVGAKALWLQYGVVHAAAIQRADEAGLSVVVDRCMKAEHARFSGGLSLTGMNSGIVTSKRRPSYPRR